MKKIIGSVIVSLVFLSVFVSAQKLRIEDISIKANGEAELISLKKDGKVAVNGSSVGVLQSDGKFKDLNGKTLAEIDKTGKVTDGDQKTLVVINKNGELDNGSGKKLGWTKDGKFSASEKDVLTLAPNKKKFYQTATFLVFLYSYPKESRTEISVQPGTP